MKPILLLFFTTLFSMTLHAQPAKTWFTNAVVIDIDPKTVILKHAAVPGLMPAMTMPFETGNVDVSTLSKGDLINFRFTQAEDTFVIQTFSVLKKKRQEKVETAKLNVDIPWDFELLNHRGETASLEDYKGKHLLVNFIYTTCPTICPTQTMYINNFYKTLSDKQRENLQLVSISVNPVHDRPEQLRQFMEKMRVKSDKNWTFFTGDETLIKRLANRFNNIAIKQSNGEIDHWAGVYLIDHTGKAIDTYATNSMDFDKIKNTIAI